MLAVKYYLSLPLPENPTKKEDLQPAIEAHYHACEAGEYDLAATIIWQSNLHFLLDLWGNPRTLIEIYAKLLPDDHFKDEPILKDKQIHGAVLGNLGLAYSDLGEPIKAIEYYKRALKISKEIENKHGEGSYLGNMGLAYSHLGEPKKAVELLNESLAIGKAIEDPRIISICEQKLKELEGSGDNRTSKDPPASKNLFRTVFSKLKSKK